MKQVLICQGRAIIEEVPAPLVEPGTVLVAVDHSCVSIGTELSGIRSSARPLWKRAVDQPEKAKRVVQLALNEGLSRTWDNINRVRYARIPIGYSVAGKVLEVGANIEGLKPGDRVACAGAQCAHHAEIVRVPRNLTVVVPKGVGNDEASTVALGAIALQGVRRASPTLGESFVVIGLGSLGHLTVQLLRSCGCRVMGTDLDAERIQLAEKLGLDLGLMPNTGEEIDKVFRFTDGIGADGVVITASNPSDTIVSTAFKMCRKKGRVVLVGDVGLNLDRQDIYAKELDFLVSTSYGPGRYDSRYEEQGLDYPVGYVRWTENRNMAEYLRLVEQGHVCVKSLISAIYPMEKAFLAYESLKRAAPSPLMVLLSYQPQTESMVRTVPNPDAVKSRGGVVAVGVIGAGSFARTTHLPNLKRLSNRYSIRAVCSRTGHNATSTARQFGAEYSSTDYQAVLDDSAVDAVIIATRHHLHAEMVLQALRAGKHVLVEKPLALEYSELAEIAQYYNDNPNSPMLLTGFNRRFSPHITRLKELVLRRSTPMIINYRMNAGYIPLDHWVHGEEGGGRNIGEACHIYDLFTYLTDAKVVEIHAQSLALSSSHYSPRDNFVAILRFSDGSLATLTYTALGTKVYPKEKLEVYVDGKVLAMDDYRSLTVHGSKEPGLQTKTIEKGQFEEIVAFADAILNGKSWPNPLWQQVQAMEISFAVEKHILGHSLNSISRTQPDQ